MAAVIVAALALGFVPASAAIAGDVAVVVNPKVKTDGLSFAELRKLLLGDRQFWSPDLQVTLIVRAAVSPERTLLLERVYEMSEAQFKRYWVAKVFRAEVTNGPTVVLSNDKLVDLVSVIDGGIALVDAADVPEGLKVLAIDGLKPGEQGYPLK